jgi:hypothetical protein
MQDLINRKKSILILVLVLTLQIIIHAPHVGKGFIKDDFIWLESVFSNGEIDYLRPLTVTTGFYRPVVSLSFALQYKIFKLNSKSYGLFNLLLHLLNIVLVYLIFSHDQTYGFYAPWIVALFAFNAKGTAFAVGWISARTTLLFTLFLLLTIWVLLKIRQLHSKQGWTAKATIFYILTGMLYLLALLSKENAVIAPVFFFLYIYIFPKGSLTKLVSWERLRQALLSVLIFAYPLIIYFSLRLRSNAFSPNNAPDYYQYSFSPGLLFKNLIEYIIRAGLLDLYIVICLILIIIVFKNRGKSPRFDENKMILAGTLWFLCFLLPTLPIASRSDLYIYFPQIGLHLVSIVIIAHLWGKIEFSKQKRPRQILIILPLVLLTAAWFSYLVVRSVAYGKEGSVSQHFSQKLSSAVSSLEPGSQIYIIDTERGEKHSPSGVISYGLDALLKMVHPQKDLSGLFITYQEISEINWAKPKAYLCFWQRNQLLGPYDSSILRSYLFLVNPHTIELSDQGKIQPQKPRKRLYRLKKRKLRLKKLQKKNEPLS